MTAPNRLLLDTHIFLWWRVEPGRLTAEVREHIASAELVFVSAVTAWEAAIKVALGRLNLPEPVEAGVVASGFEKLVITFPHAQRAAALPAHHRDPFDRMLVAQAQHEGLVLVTHDQSLRPYDVKFLWA